MALYRNQSIRMSPVSRPSADVARFQSRNIDGAQ
jgi:hypothetical protein